MQTTLKTQPQKIEIITPNPAQAALNAGLGPFLTNVQVSTLIAEDFGQAPAQLPDILLWEDRALVRTPQRTGYHKLVLEGGYWYCACGRHADGRFCEHAEAVHRHLAAKAPESLPHGARLAQLNWAQHAHVREVLSRMSRGPERAKVEAEA